MPSATVLLPALLVGLIGASEIIRDSTNPQLERISRFLTILIVPPLLVFGVMVLKRILEVF